MTTFRETKLARYSASEKESDAFGRVITVKRLAPWEQHQAMKLIDSDRATIGNPAFIASCVREIVDETGQPIMFAAPRTEADLAVVMNALDSEGMAAATIAYARLMGYLLKTADGEEQAEEADQVQLAKN